MVNSLNRSECQRAISAFCPSSQQQRVILAIAGLVCLISLPFLRPALTRAWNFMKSICFSVSDKKEPKDNIPKGRVGSSFTALTSNVQKTDFKPYSLFVKTLTGQTLTIKLIVGEERLLDFVCLNEVCPHAAQGRILSSNRKNHNLSICKRNAAVDVLVRYMV